MAFVSKDLSVLSYANGFTLWHYTTEDFGADGRLDYFNEAARMLRVGDLIVTNFNEGLDACILLVTSNANGIVEVRSIT